MCSVAPKCVVLHPSALRRTQVCSAQCCGCSRPATTTRRSSERCGASVAIWWSLQIKIQIQMQVQMQIQILLRLVGEDLSRAASAVWWSLQGQWRQRQQLEEEDHTWIPRRQIQINMQIIQKIQIQICILGNKYRSRYNWKYSSNADKYTTCECSEDKYIIIQYTQKSANTKTQKHKHANA